MPIVLILLLEFLQRPAPQFANPLNSKNLKILPMRDFPIPVVIEDRNGVVGRASTMFAVLNFTMEPTLECGFPWSKFKIPDSPWVYPALVGNFKGEKSGGWSTMLYLTISKDCPQVVLFSLF